MRSLDNFTNIGKAVLIQALGIQKNYTTIIENTVEVVDYSNPSCSSCKYKAIIENFDKDSDMYKTASTYCAYCPNKLLTTRNVTKKVYHNEKNRYGYRPMLKSNALKLLLLLHFFHPDRFGIIKNVDTREIAQKLNCNIKTVWNNLEILSSYTYISYSKTDTYSINLILNDYENYYLPAHKNGRGFLVLSFDLLNKIILLDSLVTLRIYLRELINLDNANLKGQASVDHKTFKDIRQVLPAYCKPCIIKKSIENASTDIFTTSINNNIIRFEIDKRYIAKNQKTILLQETTDKLKKFIMDFNSVIPEVNSGEIQPEKYNSFLPVDYDMVYYKLISIKKDELDDLANIAIHYSYDLMMLALSNVYKQYILFDKPIKNLPGLVSSIVRSQLDILKKGCLGSLIFVLSFTLF